MKKYPEIDYSQRPKSYWESDDVLACLLQNVKGRERREMIRSYWEQGRLQDLDETFLCETLSAEDRDRLGKIHPAFMGGEYLPDYENGEVEIARLELRSVTADVISIRARREGKLLHYRVVDEYGAEFELQRQSSRQPLTLAQLIRFIDGSSHPDLSAGLALGYNEMNANGGVTGREELQDFTTVCSELYPQLQEHYDHVFEEWAGVGE
jgi:hypothetical protein